MPFTAQTRMSGVDFDGRSRPQGRRRRRPALRDGQRRHLPPELERHRRRIVEQGGTPLAVADGSRVLGVIQLKDIVKPGMRERFDELRRWASAR